MDKKEEAAYKQQLEASRKDTRYVRMEHILQKLPFFFEKENADIVKIVKICLVGQQIRFFSERARIHAAYSRENVREAQGCGEELLPFFQLEIQRLHLHAYVHHYIPQKNACIQDTRPMLKEEHGVLTKIVYTQEETATFYQQEERKTKALFQESFFKYIERIEEHIQIHGSYLKALAAGFFLQEFEGFLHHMKSWYSEEEFAYYDMIVNEKKSLVYSDEEVQTFEKVKKIQESKDFLDGCYNELCRRKENGEDPSLYYVYCRDEIQSQLSTLRNYKESIQRDMYEKKFADAVRKVYFT